MANYVALLAATLLLVLVTLSVKIRNLNNELQQNIMTHETVRKSLQEDVHFCEQRAENYKTDVDREVAAKVAIHHEKVKLEKDIARLQQQMEKRQKDASATIEQREIENELLNSKYVEAEARLKDAKANIEAMTKERDDARTEVHKYHNLYAEGNKLLQAVRQECEAIKAFAARQTQQTDSGQKGAGETVVVAGTPVTQQNAAVKRDTQQQDTQQQSIQQRGTQQQGAQQQGAQQQGAQQQGTPSSRTTGKQPQQIQDRNVEDNEEEQENEKNAAGGVPETKGEEKSGGRNVFIVEGRDAQKGVEVEKKEAVEVREVDMDATIEEVKKEEGKQRR